MDKSYGPILYGGSACSDDVCEVNRKNEKAPTPSTTDVAVPLRFYVMTLTYITTTLAAIKQQWRENTACLPSMSKKILIASRCLL